DAVVIVLLIDVFLYVRLDTYTRRHSKSTDIIHFAARAGRNEIRQAQIGDTVRAFDLLTQKHEFFADRFFILFVYVYFISFALSREKSNDRVGPEPSFFYDAIEHLDGIIEDLSGFLPYELILENLRVFTF